jgi:hypothetical protein
LFRRIKDCTKVALLEKNLSIDKQLILMTIHPLLCTGLYVCLFEDWDLLAKVDQMWIELCHIIQEACLNNTAPTSGHQGYTLALPYMMNNAFGVLGHTANNKDNNSADTVVHRWQH